MLVVNDQSGLVVPTRNPAALAAALRRMMEDPALRQRLADAAFERVQELTWRAVAIRTLETYTRALDGVELLVLGNFTGDEVVVALPDWEDAQAVIGSPGLTLGPWEGRAYRRSA